MNPKMTPSDVRRIDSEIARVNEMSAPTPEPLSRQQMFRVVYARIFGQLREVDWRRNPKKPGARGGWGTHNGRRRGRELARKMARDFMRKAERRVE